MSGPVSVASWSEPAARPDDSAFVRLWRAFGTSRIVVALVVLGLLAAQGTLTPPTPALGWLLGLGVLYLGLAVAMRGLLAPPGRELSAQWLGTMALDLSAIATLQVLQPGGLTFSPLFALPVLMAAVLGGAVVAYGTAAGVSLLVLGDAWLHLIDSGGSDAPRFLQAGLTGCGYFVVAFLVNHLAARLAREEQKARLSQEAAQLQSQVNELVIETLGDGILVVDGDGQVRASNPTACTLLGLADTAPGFRLDKEPGWQGLLDLARRTLDLHVNQTAEIAVGRSGEQQRRLFVRTRLAANRAPGGDGSLCVLLLEDLREVEARLRTEKLAAMGRMSAAVAHEIRNPLAAIAQANDLLDEDLTDPGHRQLSALVRQNTRRLAQIAEEILDVSRVQQQASTHSPLQHLDPSVGAACQDWARQARAEGRLRVALGCAGAQVRFEADHLRRVLVNLLDNALRYAGNQADSIQVATALRRGQLRLSVWSDGAPLQPRVQQHLFEPFFSSESRSSGLGLYICRELCERHGAEIAYRRGRAPLGGREGNEFTVIFRPRPDAAGGAATPATIAA